MFHPYMDEEDVLRCIYYGSIWYLLWIRKTFMII